MKWLFLCTFIALCGLQPIYGWLCGKVHRDRLMISIYSFVIGNLLGFYFAFKGYGASPPLWVARTFYVWVSVFNLFVVSLFWSFMADLFRLEQAQRLFGVIAAGGSLGAIAGPAITALSVFSLGLENLLLLSAGLISLAAAFMLFLMGRQGLCPSGPSNMGGSPWGGLHLLLQSKRLQAIAAFVFLSTTIVTCLYLQQAQMVDLAFDNTYDRTRLLASLDLAVNISACLVQLFITGRVVHRWGLSTALTVLPGFSLLGFSLLTGYPFLSTLVFVQVSCRSLNYALAKPAREMLFTLVDHESRYKAKALLDTVVHRSGDVLNIWVFSALIHKGASLSQVASIGLLVSAVWLLVARQLGKEKPAPVAAPG